MPKTPGARDKMPRPPRVNNPRKWREVAATDPARLHNMMLALPAELLATAETFAEQDAVATATALRLALIEHYRNRQII